MSPNIGGSFNKVMQVYFAFGLAKYFFCKMQIKLGCRNTPEASPGLQEIEARGLRSVKVLLKAENFT